MKKMYIIYALGIILLLLLLEGSLELTYIPKQLLRIGLFLVIPMALIYFVEKSTLQKKFHFGKPTWKEIKIALLSSAVIFIGTVGGYYVLRTIFVPSTTIEGLESIGVTVENMLFWGLYLSIVNSFVEEFFFRGIIYVSIETYSELKAIIFSALLFSIYHGLLFYNIFEWYTVIFTLVGLFIIGMFFAFVNRYGKAFVNSYIVHIFANIGCVLVLLHMVSRTQ